MLTTIQVLVVSLCLAVSYSLPTGGFSFAAMQKMALASTRNENTEAGSEQVKTLGKLSTLHAVGISLHPTENSKLIYADETALYEFDKASGESRLIAGGESSGLIADRKSVDGVGSEAKFKFITKIMARKSGVYVFDYDSLRKYIPQTQNIETVTSLKVMDWFESYPATGVVNQDENAVFFSLIEGYGHFVMKLSIPNGDPSKAELVAAGPTLISSIELSFDEKKIFLGDVELNNVVEVDIKNGDQTFLVKESKFYPGALAVLDAETILAINSDTDFIQKFKVGETVEARMLCDDACTSDIKNPLNLAVDNNNTAVYVLDSIPHPTLPTYSFSIKKVSLNNAVDKSSTTKPASQEDFSQMLKFYSRWFTNRNSVKQL